MNKKVPLIIIGILWVAFLGVYLILKDNKPAEDKKGKENIQYKYLIINNESVWGNYEDSKWKKLSVNSVKNDKYLVFVNDKYFGSYYLRYVNNWNLLDDNNNFVNYDGKFIATSLDFAVDVDNFDVINIDNEDMKVIRSIIGNNIDIDDLSLNQKVIKDLDNNGINDAIVSVSNLDATNQSMYFNLVYVVLNNVVDVIINNKIDVKELYNEPIYQIAGIIGLNNNVNKNIILQKGYFSEAGETSNMMFQYQEGKYKLIIED